LRARHKEKPCGQFFAAYSNAEEASDNAALKSRFELLSQHGNVECSAKFEASIACHRPLIEIDYYGERLIGCIDCNRWGKPGDATLPIQLREDDLETIRASRDPAHRKAASGQSGVVGS
jgi:hypothetical protein